MKEPLNCTSSELSIYLRGLEEGYLVTSCSDTNQSAQLKSTPIARKFLLQGNKTVTFPGFPSLMMSKNSMETFGEDAVMSSPGDFPVKTLVPLEEGKELKAKNLGYGKKCQELSVRYNRDTHSWRTHHFFYDEDLPWSSVTFPKWGMMLDGVCWALSTLVRHIGAKESGYMLTGKKTHHVPTPTASDHIERTPTRQDKGAKFNPETNKAMSLDRWLCCYPTPTTVDSGSYFNRSDSPGATLRPTLGAMARYKCWPTPMVPNGGRRVPKGAILLGDDSPTAYCEGKKYQVGLEQVVQWSPNAETNNKEAQEPKGALNPTFVEWLMGWPIGWTVKQDMAVPSFNDWKQKNQNTITWWDKEPVDIPRVTIDRHHLVDRLTALGNGQVPAVVAESWHLLSSYFVKK